MNNAKMQWIASSDIEDWSDKNKKDCQEYLPLLIRYLIRETIPGISSMRFPAVDATQYSGWDGILEVKLQMQNIPFGVSFFEGMSYWEIGTNKDIWEKANSDYNKRTINPKGYDIENSTFIFVTPRIWEDASRKNAKENYGKDEWIEEKMNEKKWKDIKVLDARDLEEWIQQCPTTGIWLAKHIKKYPPEGIESAVDFWERWIYNPQYSFTHKLVLAGRKTQSDNLENWLRGDFETYTLKSLTKEESISFLCAVMYSLEDSQRDYYFSRCLIITDKEIFKQISKIHKDHILILDFDDPGIADYASSLGNHVFVPITPEDTVNPPQDELGLLGREELIKGLKEMGFTEDEAYSYSKDSGRSLSVLRRLLNYKHKQPDWAKKENSVFLLPALLIGKWDDNNKNDKNIIQELSNISYNDYIAKLNLFKIREDPPIYNISNKWGIRSQYDACFILAPFLTKPFVEKFFKIAYDILHEIDPEYFIDEDERWRAQEKGAVRKYSSWLRDGILNSIILLSIFSEKTENIDLKKQIDKLVHNLLNKADEKRWFSVANILPQIAEASPEIFLDCVESSLDSDKKIMILFREGKDALFSRCNHAGFLWSLEGLAWFPDYISRVTLILGKLAKLDKNIESRWANRPIGSLRGIFLAWMPNTIASLDQRLGALDSLIINNKEIAFDLLFKLMPVHHDIGNPAFKFRWRGFSDLKSKGKKKVERDAAFSKYFEKLINVVENNGYLLAKVVPIYDDLNIISDRIRLYEHIASNIKEMTEGKKEIKQALWELISRHKSFPKAPWVMPEIDIRKLEILYNQIPYDNIEEEYKFLFDDHYPNIGVDKTNHEEYEKKLSEDRIKAINVLYKSVELTGIIKFADKVKQSFFLGETLGVSGLIEGENEIKILDLFDDSDRLVWFAKGYASYKIRNHGINWINNTVKIINEKDYNDDLIVNFLVLLNPGTESWDIINKYSDNIQTKYWKKWTGFLRDLTPEELSYGYTKLLENKRYYTALDSASMYPDNISNEILIEILRKAGTELSDEPYKSFIEPYHITRLFQVLDDRAYSNENEMAKLEWLYISVLSDDISRRQPKLLYKRMCDNPEFFVEVLRAIFKPKNDINLEKKETEGLTKEYINSRSSAAYDLLKSFKIIPGEDEKGIIDFNILKIWVDKVRILCKNYKREYIGDYQIGELLAYSKVVDEIWPQDAVCEIIELLKSESIEEGFYICERNKRGSYTKAMFEGGNQEREEMKKYIGFANKLLSKYPRTIKILKKVAKSYEYEARREDDEAEQDELEY